MNEKCIKCFDEIDIYFKRFSKQPHTFIKSAKVTA